MCTISVESYIEDEYKKLNELLKSKIKILEAQLDKNIDERMEYLKLLRYDRSLHPEYDLAIQKGFEINYDLEQTKSRLKEVDNYFIKREMIVKHLKDKLLELDNKVKPLKSLSLKGKLSHESKAVQQPDVQPDSALGGGGIL